MLVVRNPPHDESPTDETLVDVAAAFYFTYNLPTRQHLTGTQTQAPLHTLPLIVQYKPPHTSATNTQYYVRLDRGMHASEHLSNLILETSVSTTKE